MKKSKKTSWVKKETREWIEAIVVATILALFIRTFFIQAFKIPSGSMIPTLRPGDRILVNKLFYGPRLPLLDIKLPMLKQPRRADVVVFVYPESANLRKYSTFSQYLDDESKGALLRRMFLFFKDTASKDYIKRLIGLYSETVEIRNGDIYINGKICQDDKIRRQIYLNEGPFGQPDQVIRVPDNAYYCLGDNSSSSRDSRYWGFVEKKYLVGKAMFIYWPLNRIGIIR